MGTNTSKEWTERVDGTLKRQKLDSTDSTTVIESSAKSGTTLTICPELEVPHSLLGTVQNYTKIKSLARPSPSPRNWGPRRGEAEQATAGGLVDDGAYSRCDKPLLANGHSNGFINAVVTAFAQHYPLSLRPQHIWLLVLQGVARHVDQNAEALREKWVTHAGKMTLTVSCDDFRIGQPNPWASVVDGRADSFAAQIGQHTVEGVCELLCPRLGGTSAEERIAQRITVMDVCKNYFAYRVTTKCGFPSITLEGSPGDWALVRSQAEALLQQQCLPEFARRWAAALLPVLDRFAAAAAAGDARPSEEEADFWNSMCKRGASHGSGARTWFSGWFNVFFPVIRRRFNRYCVPYRPGLYMQSKAKYFSPEETERRSARHEGWREQLGLSASHGRVPLPRTTVRVVNMDDGDEDDEDDEDDENDEEGVRTAGSSGHYSKSDTHPKKAQDAVNVRDRMKNVQGPDILDFPNGLSEAPVEWEYFDQKINLLFKSGFVGTTQDPKTKALSPHIGWFIQKDPQAGIQKGGD